MVGGGLNLPSETMLRLRLMVSHDKDHLMVGGGNFTESNNVASVTDVEP